MAYVKFPILARNHIMALSSVAIYFIFTSDKLDFHIKLSTFLMLVPVSWRLMPGPRTQRIYYILIFALSVALGGCATVLNDSLDIKPVYKREIREERIHLAMSYFLISEVQYWRHRYRGDSLQSEGTYWLGVTHRNPRLIGFNKWFILAFNIIRTASWYYLFMFQMHWLQSELRGDPTCNPLWPKPCFNRGIFLNTGHWWANMVLDLLLLRWKRAFVDWIICAAGDLILWCINKVLGWVTTLFTGLA